LKINRPTEDGHGNVLLLGGEGVRFELTFLLLALLLPVDTSGAVIHDEVINLILVSVLVIEINLLVCFLVLISIIGIIVGAKEITLERSSSRVLIELFTLSRYLRTRNRNRDRIGFCTLRGAAFFEASELMTILTFGSDTLDALAGVFFNELEVLW